MKLCGYKGPQGELSISMYLVLPVQTNVFFFMEAGGNNEYHGLTTDKATEQRLCCEITQCIQLEFMFEDRALCKAVPL